jgi:drug/metabolite transporter (DMT)-like permease
MGNLSRTQTMLLIVFLVIIWGVNWPLSKLALSYTPPVLFSGMRTLVGGILLLAIALPRWKRLHFKKTWAIYLISALFNVALYYGLQTIGLNYLPAGLFSAIVFLQPVLVGLFSWMWLGESMNGLKIMGLGIVLALGSALSWALGTIYVKKTSADVDPVWLVTLQLIAGGIFMTAIGSGVENWSDINWKPAFVFCLLFISIFVIAIGWLAFYKLMDSGEASKVASYTFLIPLVAILIGTLFFHEPFTLSLLAGLVMIIVSIYFVNRSPRKLAVNVCKH